MFTINQNNTYTKVDTSNVTLVKRARLGYVRVKSIKLKHPVPPMETVEGTFQMAR